MAAAHDKNSLSSFTAEGRCARCKLQMQITADVYVAGPQGQLDWMTVNMDAAILGLINEQPDVLNSEDV
jgi:hypothetical protein